MSGNLFLNVTNKFQYASKDELYALTQAAFANCLTEFVEAFEERTVVLMMLTLARIGVGHTYQKDLNDDEIDLVDEIFSDIFNDMEQIYEVVSAPVDETEYNLVRQVIGANLCNLDMLSFILGFAYADGHLDTLAAEKLESLFGVSLMMEFFNSDLEDVPAPQIRVTGLEVEIMEWFTEDDQLRPFKDIKNHFRGVSTSKLQEALDNLCNKGLLYCADTFVGKMYGLQ